jgi:hypothetical protein
MAKAASAMKTLDRPLVEFSECPKICIQKYKMASYSGGWTLSETTFPIDSRKLDVADPDS